MSNCAIVKQAYAAAQLVGDGKITHKASLYISNHRCTMTRPSEKPGEQRSWYADILTRAARAPRRRFHPPHHAAYKRVGHHSVAHQGPESCCTSATCAHTEVREHPLIALSCPQGGPSHILSNPQDTTGGHAYSSIAPPLRISLSTRHCEPSARGPSFPPETSIMTFCRVAPHLLQFLCVFATFNHSSITSTCCWKQIRCI